MCFQLFHNACPVLPKYRPETLWPKASQYCKSGKALYHWVSSAKVAVSPIPCPPCAATAAKQANNTKRVFTSMAVLGGGLHRKRMERETIGHWTQCNMKK